MSGRPEPTCINLKEYFPRYRLQWDESHVPGQAFDPWLLEIPGRYGKIYPYGGDELCAYTDRPRMKARLKALPGAVLHQEGDFELVVRFPVDNWKPYFKVLRAKRKALASSEAVAASSARLQKFNEVRQKGASEAVETESNSTRYIAMAGRRIGGKGTST